MARLSDSGNPKDKDGYVGLQEADVAMTPGPAKPFQVKSPLLRECMAEFIGTMRASQVLLNSLSRPDTIGTIAITEEMPPRNSDTNDKADNEYIGLQEADVVVMSEPIKPYQVKSPLLRECMAEFIGTMVLILFGDGVVAQVVLSEGTKGEYININLCWGLAAALYQLQAMIRDSMDKMEAMLRGSMSKLDSNYLGEPDVAMMSTEHLPAAAYQAKSPLIRVYA
ncbi:hypothetical protein KRP22_014131 [Phytophthora ramorum]|nr:Aquaporin-10 [Phytophthora ramorum]